eukprot:gene940-1455_t
MTGASVLQVLGQEKLEAAVLKRPAGQGLVTVSNHVASIDDPLVLAAALPHSALLESAKMRWTLCATDRCHKHALLRPLFRTTKTLPIERGAGLEQFGMREAKNKLAQGDWVHIFPEGTRSRDGKVAPAKRGIGSLVAGSSHDSAQVPLIVPLIHVGMENVIPRGTKLPGVGQEVTVIIGDPIMVDDLIEEHRLTAQPPQVLYDAIADRIGKTLQKMHREHTLGPDEDVPVQEAEGLHESWSLEQGLVSSEKVFWRFET